MRSFAKSCIALLVASTGLIGLSTQAAAPIKPITAVAPAQLELINGRKVLRIQLSKDKAQREQQLQFARKQIALKKLKQKIGPGRAGSTAGCDDPLLQTEDCDGDDRDENGDYGNDYDIWVEQTEYYFSDVTESKIPVLEKVVVTGKRCVVSASSVYGSSGIDCDQVSELFNSPLGGLDPHGLSLGDLVPLAEIKKDIYDLVKAPFAVLPKCAKLPTARMWITPDFDHGNGYEYAVESLRETYKGELTMLHAFDRFDVQYPGGEKVRYLINAWSISTADLQPSVILVRLGYPDPDTTPCK